MDTVGNSFLLILSVSRSQNRIYIFYTYDLFVVTHVFVIQGKPGVTHMDESSDNEWDTVSDAESAGGKEH
eukprot:m.236240 g.236240  ORF g.236240 m.236240 type:complete len:70 (+) comp33682_c0_seq3:165-374(+)